MKLIDADEYESLLLRHSQKPQEFNLQKSEEQASCVLNQDLPDDIKLALYMQIAKDFNQKVTEILNKPVKVDVITPKQTAQQVSSQKNESIPEEKPNDDDYIISCLPNSFRENARYILDILKQYPELIEWDRNNIKFDGKIAAGANIIDLLSYLLRDSSIKAPVGSGRFLILCKRANIPASFVKKKLRDRFLDNFENFKSVKSSSESFSNLGEYKNKLDNINNWVELQFKNGKVLTSTPIKKANRADSFVDETFEDAE